MSRPIATETSALRRRQLLVLLAALLAHAPSLRNGFTTWDDTAFVHNNPLNRSLPGLGRIWTTLETPQYYPLSFSLYWAEYQLWGPRAFGYHAVSIALHALNAALVVALLVELGLTPVLAGLIALLFAVAPFQVMSVAWIAEQKNLLSTCFALLATRAIIRYFSGAGRSAFLTAFILFVAAMLSKTAWLVWPLVAAASGVWVYRLPIRRVALALLPFALFAVGIAVLSAHVERGYIDALQPSLSERLCAAPRALLWYVALAIAPLDCAPFHGRWPLDPARVLAWWPAGLVAVAVLALFLVRGRLSPISRWGIAWFVILLIPVIGIAPYGNLAVSSVSDHYLYAACMGLYVAVVPAVARLLRTRWPSKPIGAALACVLVAALVAGSWRQIPTWHDDLSLWQAVVDRDPDSLVGLCGRGKAWITRNEVDRAIADYRRVVTIKPDLAEARADLGQFLIAGGRNREAAGELSRALTSHPRPAAVWSDLGVALDRAGDPGGAADAFNRAIALAPDDPNSYARLGDLLARQGNYSDAIQCLRDGLSRVPPPKTWRIRDTLARILATVADPALHNSAAAVALAEQNSRMSDDIPAESLETLAIAYAAANRYEEATRFAQSAADKFEASARPDRAAAARQRFARYHAAWSQQHELDKRR